MDINELVEVLQSTLDPARREQAEQQLHEVRNKKDDKRRPDFGRTKTRF